MNDKTKIGKLTHASESLAAANVLLTKNPAAPEPHDVRDALAAVRRAHSLVTEVRKALETA